MQSEIVANSSLRSLRKHIEALRCLQACWCLLKSIDDKCILYCLKRPFRKLSPPCLSKIGEFQCLTAAPEFLSIVFDCFQRSSAFNGFPRSPALVNGFQYFSAWIRMAQMHSIRPGGLKLHFTCFHAFAWLRMASHGLERLPSDPHRGKMAFTCAQ